jgi:hypothetical protein
VKKGQATASGPDAWCEVSVLKVKAVGRHASPRRHHQRAPRHIHAGLKGLWLGQGLGLTGPGQGCGQARHVAAPTRSMQAGARLGPVARLG